MASNLTSTETDLKKLQLELAAAGSDPSLSTILQTQIALQQILIECDALNTELGAVTNNEQSEQIEKQTTSLEDRLKILTPSKEFLDNIKSSHDKKHIDNQRFLDKWLMQKKLLALRQEAEAERERLDGVKKASTKALQADNTAAITTGIATALAIAGIFFPPLLVAAAIVGIVSSVGWTLSTDTWRKGDIANKRSMPLTGVAGIAADAMNGTAGVAFGVATGLAAFAAGAAAIIAAPVLMAGSAVLWMGSSALKLAKNPNLANTLGAMASVANAAATGLAIGLAFTAVAGLTVLTGGLVLGAIALVSAGLWLASAVKNYFDRKKDLATLSTAENSHATQNEPTNKKTNIKDYSNDLEPTNLSQIRSPEHSAKSGHSKFSNALGKYATPAELAGDATSPTLIHSFDKPESAAKASLHGLTTSSTSPAPAPSSASQPSTDPTSPDPTATKPKTPRL